MGGPHCRLFSVSSSIASLFPFVVLPLALLAVSCIIESSMGRGVQVLDQEFVVVGRYYYNLFTTRLASYQWEK